MAKKADYSSMFTLRKDGRYMATYTDERGRHCIYDRDPKKLYEKLLALEQPAEVSFWQVAGEWERAHREDIEERTWNNYAPHYQDIIAKHGKKPFSAVTAVDVDAHLKIAKAKGLSATVVNTIRSIYRMIFDYAVINGYAPYNPVSSVRLPKGLKRGKRMAPTEEQIKAIMGNVDKPFGLFPFFLLCTGMRKSEALALTWADVDLRRKEIQVNKSLNYLVGSAPTVKTPKTDAGTRVVSIVDILLPELKAAKEKSKSDYLFPQPTSSRGGKGGGLMTERSYEGAWFRYCEEAGLLKMGADGKPKPAITAHNLRHGTATLMFESDVDELTVQRTLGHSRVEITREIYTDLREGQRKKSVAKFNTTMNKYRGGENEKK